MNPWIRRLAMMLGIVVPGFFMILFQVHPVMLFLVLALIAVGILFAVGSLTIADLKGLRRSVPEEPAAEPEGATGPARTGTTEKPVGKTSRFSQISVAMRNLATVVRGQWATLRGGKSRMEAIDRALDHTVPGPAPGAVTASPRPSSPGVMRAGPRGPAGDPFQDLLNANFEPVILDEEVPENRLPPGGKGLAEKKVPDQRLLDREILGKIIPDKKIPEGESLAKAGPPPGPAQQKATETEPAVTQAGPKKETTTVKNPTTVKVESLTSLPAGGTAAASSAAPSRVAEIPAKGAPAIPVKGRETTDGTVPGVLASGEGDPSSATVSVTVTETGTAAAGSTAAGRPGQAAEPDILSFTSEAGGTMDDLLATLRADDTRVKRSDDSSLLRNLKGVRIQGTELVDDLSALLKELQ